MVIPHFTWQDLILQFTFSFERVHKIPSNNNLSFYIQDFKQGYLTTVQLENVHNYLRNKKYIYISKQVSSLTP